MSTSIDSIHRELAIQYHLRKLHDEFIITSVSDVDLQIIKIENLQFLINKTEGTYNLEDILIKCKLLKDNNVLITLLDFAIDQIKSSINLLIINEDLVIADFLKVKHNINIYISELLILKEFDILLVSDNLKLISIIHSIALLEQSSQLSELSLFIEKLTENAYQLFIKKPLIKINISADLILLKALIQNLVFNISLIPQVA